MECGAKEKKNEKKNKEEKRERERGGNDCKICFQKVIPPTLSVRILNVVFIVKKNVKKMCIHLFYLFSANEYIPYFEK